MGLTASDAQADELEPVLAAALGAGSVEVLARQPLSTGASRLTWALDVRADDRVCHLVLQRERAPGRGIGDMRTEARLLRAAAANGVPVPAVLAAGGSGPGGAYLITSRVDGETIPRRILRDPDLAGARARFAVQCGQILAAIHAIDIDVVAPLVRTDALDQIEQMLDRVAPRPAFEWALRWLRVNRPALRRTTVVHGDFRTGNLILGPDGVRAVLDWELAHAGEPLEDLGWLCARVWRWGARPVVGGMGSLAELLDAYAEHGGGRVSEADVFWWQALATLRWGAICLEQARVHLQGEFHSVELAVLGRRAAEMEYELLRMLP